MSLFRLVAPAATFVALALGSDETRADTPTQGGCQVSQGSLAFLGCSLAQKLLPSAAAASVTVVDLKSDRELPAPEALRERVQSTVKSALRAGGDAKANQRSKLSVELRIEKSGGVLRVSADVRRATGLWQRTRHRKPSVEQHAFAEAPLDAELRALIPPPPLVVTETVRLKAPERGIVALACGPLGSDGGQELVLVSRASVRVGRVARQAFVERKRVAWSALSAVAPAPLREPIGSAEITPSGAVRVGLSDRRDGLELSRELQVIERFEGAMPLPGGGCAARAGLGLAGQESCAAKWIDGRTPPIVLDAVAGAPSGWLGRELASGKLVGSRLDLAQPANRPGAQLAFGDVDNDGNPELAFSADTLDAAKDRVTLVTLSGNKLTPRFELPAPGISAIAFCSRREGPGMAPIVLATGDELWLLR